MTIDNNLNTMNFTHIHRVIDKKFSPNKYFSFNESIHSVMTVLNRSNPSAFKDVAIIKHLLSNSWNGDGYDDKIEESLYFIKGIILLCNYVNRPLDIGIENILINKTLCWKIKGNKTLSCKIDKVYEHEDGLFEIVDYKTGRLVNHTDNFKLDMRTALYIILLYENLKVLANSVSYYYLRPNKKFTRIVLKSDLNESYRKIFDHFKYV